MYSCAKENRVAVETHCGRKERRFIDTEKVVTHCHESHRRSLSHAKYLANCAVKPFIQNVLTVMIIIVKYI